MKILVSFQPTKKASDFEGVRLRKTIKGALEMVGIEYTTSIVDKYDVMHLISPDDENKENDAKENGIPVIVSALYCEDDPLASYLEHKNKDVESYERLEFLGDKVLDFIVSEYLYKNMHELEGEMTKIRASHVCEDALS